MSANEEKIKKTLEENSGGQSYVRLILKDKGEFLGTIFRSGKQKEWIIVTPQSKFAGTMNSESLGFDSSEVESIEPV
jgi:hypothetical protein